MAELADSARRLLRLLTGRRSGARKAGEVHPGHPTEADGDAAVAALESWIAEGAGIGGAFPAAGAAARFRREAEAGEGNLFRRPLSAVGATGGRSALASAVGLQGAGVRATAFLSGPDLVASADLFAEASRRRLPLVVHLAARAGGGSLGSGHDAYHRAAASGALHFFAADVQEAVDLTLIARRVAEESLTPALVAMDGPETALAVQDFLLPEGEGMARYLGDPSAPVHPPTPAQELLFGRHRRRVPRWHDAERPLLLGPAEGPEVAALAEASRRIFFELHLPALLDRAREDFAAWTGRRYGPLRDGDAGRGGLLLLAQGSAVAVAEAAAAALRAEGLKVGAAGVRVLRPFPASELVELVRGRRVVAVLERADAPASAEPPLLAELRALLERARTEDDPELPSLADREVPQLASVRCGLGGLPLRGADVAALGRRLLERSKGKGEEERRTTFYLGVGSGDDTGADDRYPTRQALLDGLERSYPGLSRLGVRAATGAGPELRPEGAFTVAVHRPAGAAGELAGEVAGLLRNLLAGHLRTRPAVGWEGWGAGRVDTVTHAPAPFPDPGDDLAAEVAVVLPPADPASVLRRVGEGGALLVPGGAGSAAFAGELRRVAGERGVRVYVAGGPSDRSDSSDACDLSDNSDLFLGALAGVLAAEGRAEVTLRRLLEARRRMLEERGLEGDTVETRLDRLQAGFEGFREVEPSAAPAAVAPGADETPVPAALRRLGRGGSPIADPASLHGRAGILYREGAEAELTPDPFLAAGALPPFTAALRSAPPAGVGPLPAFDPAPCTGCGDCWSVCPDGAVVPVVAGAAALLDRGMELARRRGGSVDKLRMVTSKLAAQVEKAAAGGWQGGTAAELFDAAFDPLLERMKLPADRKAGIREAYLAVRDELAKLPVARTDPFFGGGGDDEKGGELLALGIDPDACKRCGLCVAACEPDALTLPVGEAGGAGGEAARVAGAVELRRLLDELPETGDGTVERACGHPEVGPLAGALLSPAARRITAGRDGAEAGSGEGLAVRRLLGVVAHHLEERRRGLISTVEKLQEELSEAIHGGLSHALPDRDLDALARGLDALGHPDADLAELTARVETAFETERVDVARTRRLVASAQALADLGWRLRSGDGGLGRAPFGVVAALGDGPASAPGWSVTFPHHPFAVPVTVDATGDAAALARGILEGQLRETVEIVRALRRARLELDRPKEAPRLARELDLLGWSDLTDDERRYAPPLLLVAPEAILAGAGLADLLAALGDRRPLLVAALADPDAGDEGAAATGTVPSCIVPSFELLLAAAGVPGTVLAQSSIADPDQLAASVAAALDGGGPALLRIHAPSPRRRGLAADGAVDHARRALESGAFVTFLLRPEDPGRPILEGLAAGVGAELESAELESGEAPTQVDVGAGAATAELERRHAAELEALRRDYEARLAQARAGYQLEVAQRIRGKLMRLAAGHRPASRGDGDGREMER